MEVIIISGVVAFTVALLGKIVYDWLAKPKTETETHIKERRQMDSTIHELMNTAKNANKIASNMMTVVAHADNLAVKNNDLLGHCNETMIRMVALQENILDETRRQTDILFAIKINGGKKL